MKIGSLFSGYLGLDMAVEAAFGATTAWVSDIDKGACKILAHRFPDVPNLGDITAIDWADVEPVDIITGGSPCQDLSNAGRRAGMTEGTRSNLWVAMREAIAQVKPTYVVWENVRGAFSAAADSSLEFCPGCMGDPRSRGTVLRALGRILGDLSDLGYDTQWRGLRAADVGAPHGRFRVFVVARLADANGAGLSGIGRFERVERDADRRRGEGADGNHLQSETGLTLFRPTPAVNDMGRAYTPEEWDEWTARTKTKHGNGNGHGKSLEVEAARLLPTPTTRDHKDHMIRREPHRPDDVDTLSRALTQFGVYAPAITRWEQVIGRLAPTPTEPTGRNGAHRLSPRFTEFMMGLPADWTQVPGITRNEELKAHGNGVVPQQAYAAIVDCLRAYALQAVA